MSEQDEEKSTDSDSYIEWLEACDEAIAKGRSPPDSVVAQGPEQDMLDLLCRLDGLRPQDAAPRGHSYDDEAAVADTEAVPPAGDGPSASPSVDPTLPEELDTQALETIALPCSFGDYELLELIAKGGMGIVYQARQRSLNRFVALKMIRLGPWVTRSDLRRFQREAGAAAQLDHPNIVPVHEVGQVDDQPFFSMKLMEGGSLADAVVSGQRSVVSREANQQAARLVVAIAEAVHHAHQHGILHRDLKPGNVLLDAEGRPCVADFGLARSLEGESTLTQHGSIVGTPSYMAPEQAAGVPGNATIAADVYSLGAILYALITGRPPFNAKTPIETLRQVIDQEPVPPRAVNPKIDRDLEAICLKALDKKPKRRYPSASALAEDLEQWLAGKSIRARRIGRPERVWKWAKRHPGVAALSGLVVLVAAAGLIGMFVLYGQAVVARAHAVEQTKKALQALQSSEASLYANRIALADRYRQVHDADRSDELLDDCPVALRDWEWRYLKRRSFEDVRVYGDHDGVVAAAVFSPDGRYLVSVDGGGSLHIRDRTTCRVLRRPCLLGLSALAISPDGEWLAVGGYRGDIKTGAIKLWSTKTWSEVKSLSGVGEATHALAFSPDSRRLVSGHQDDKVRVWDVATGTSHTLAGHKSMVEDVAFSPDGRLIASASRDTTVRIWDTETGALLTTLSHERQVFSVAFHPRGRLLASSTGEVVTSSRGDLVLWDLDSARVVRKAPALAGMVYKARFSPSGRRLATAGYDGVVRIWDSTTLNELLPLAGHTPRAFWVAFSRDGDELISGGDDGIRCWNAGSLPERPQHHPLRTFSGHEQPIPVLALTPDGSRLISGSDDGTARVWDLETGRQLLCYREHKQPPFALAVRPDARAVATSGNDRVIRIWDPRTGADLIQLHGHTAPVMALAYHLDGVRLASASQDGTVRLWDSRTGEQLHQFLGPPFWLFALAFSHDGGRLAAAGDINGVHVWDVASRKLLHVLYGHSQRVVAVAFHPDDDRLLSASNDGTVRLWRSLTGHLVRVFDGVRGRGLAWTPDGRRFAMSGAGGSLKVWESDSGRRILTLQGHADEIANAAFTPDGLRLFTAGWDHTIKLWETSPDAPELWGGESQHLAGHPRPATVVAVLPDGKRAISGCEGAPLSVWDIASGRELRRWNGSDSKVYALAVTPDGERVVVAGERTQCRVYEIESGRELRRFNPHDGIIYGLAVTPDGRHALTGGPIPMTLDGWGPVSDRDLHLWDLNTGEEVRHFPGHQDGVWPVAISPDGHRAVSGSMDGTVRAWDIATGAEVVRFEGHKGGWVTVIGFLPNGRRVLSGGTDYHLRLWDLETGRELRRFDGLRGPAPIDCLAIAPDGRHALSSGKLDPRLRVWDLEAGYEVYHYEVPHVQLTRGTFTRDGRQAIWAASDGALRIWDIPEQFTGGRLTREFP
jgi:WD40 repeat protein